MKKAISHISALLLVCALLGGCGKLINPAPSSVPASPNPSIIASPTPSPIASATPEPILLSTDIPDVVRDENEYMQYSYREMYEDANNIYLAVEGEDSSTLYAVSTSTGEASTIGEECFDFTYSDGYIYWIRYEKIDDEGNAVFNTIYKYNVSTKQNSIVKKFRNSVYSLFAKGKRLYLMYERYSEKEQEEKGIDWFSDLYSMSLDGQDIKKIAENAYEAGVYQDKFYITKNSEEGAPVYEYDPTIKKIRNITEDAANDFYFTIGYGKLFYNGFENGFTMVDLKTLEGTALPDIEDNAFAIMGQYLLYITKEKKNLLMGYDIRTGKTYTLCLVEPLGCIPEIHSTPYNTYLSDGGTNLFKLVIQDGKAGLEEVAKQ